MERSARYELLPNEDDETSVQNATQPADGSPEVLSQPTGLASRTGSESVMEPPSYNVAVDLPSYDDYMRAKQNESEQSCETPIVHREISLESRHRVDGIIGTDGMFVLGFIFAFLFNWVGLVAAFCLMRTCAGRFGALSGFGLSLVKWVSIAKQNNWSVGIAEENPWIWWLLLSFGLLISCSGILQYLRIKHVWSRARDSAEVARYLF